MRIVQPQNKEAGFVSLFSVIFFMLLLTVITLGFLRIMGIEQQQSLDNDLTSSAVAAAESGIEDGKRAIVAYNTTTDATLKAALASAFGSTACDSLTSSSTIRGALNIDSGGNAIGNSALNQYYTCLTVNLNSPNYINNETAGTSDYVPLVAVGGAYEQVQVSWHLISQAVGTDGDGIPAQYPITTALPPINNVNGNPTNSWTYYGYPSFLRVGLYGYPSSGNFTRADIDARSHSLLLVPGSQSNSAAASSTTPIDFGANDPRGVDQAKTPLQQIKCISNPSGNVGAYACTALLSLPAGFTSSNTNYYLRLTPQYGQSHFQVTLMHNGAPVNMSGVQPIIDATGRAADVYRREQARVRVNPPGNLPEFTTQSANTICKNMVVSDGSFYQANNCP